MANLARENQRRDNELQSLIDVEKGKVREFYEAKISQIHGESGEIWHQNQILDRELRQSRTQVTNLEGQVNDLAGKLQEMSGHQDKMDKEMKATRQANNEYLQQIDKMTAELQDLKKNSADFQEVIKDLERNLHGTVTQKEEKETVNRDLIHQLEQEIASLRGEITETQEGS